MALPRTCDDHRICFGGSVCFAVEGNINCTGATVKWVTDKLGP